MTPSARFSPIQTWPGRLSPALIAERASRQPINRLVWVCLWITLIPQLIPAFGEMFSSFRILPVIGAAGFLGALLLPRSILGNWSVYWPLLFLAAVTFSTVMNRFLGNSWEGGISYVYLIASGVSLHCMIVATVTTRRRFILLSTLVIVGALVTTSSLVWSNLVSGAPIHNPDGIAVQTGLLENRNWLAPYLLGGLGACASLMELYQRRWRTVLAACTVGLYLGAFFTGSRGTVTTATFFMGLWLVGVTSKQRAVRLFALATMLVTLWSIQNLPVVSYTFKRLFLTEETTIVHERRYHLITSAVDIWQDNILFGAGLGAVWAKTGGAAHMAFTGLLAETGVFGLSLFYLPAFSILAKSFGVNRAKGRTKEQQKLLRVLAIGLLAFLFHGLFNETYFIKSFYIHLGLLSVVMRANWLGRTEVRSPRRLVLYE